MLSSHGVIADLPWCGRGCSVLCDHCRPSLWFSHGFGSRTLCCLAVLLLLPLLAQHPLIFYLGFTFWCCHPTACLLTCLDGDGAAPSFVVVVVSHFCWAVVSARVMPRVIHFILAPSSCASSPLYMLGVGRGLPLAGGLLAD